jgi:hypothetical protein
MIARVQAKIRTEYFPHARLQSCCYHKLWEAHIIINIIIIITITHHHEIFTFTLYHRLCYPRARITPCP